MGVADRRPRTPTLRSARAVAGAGRGVVLPVPDETGVVSDRTLLAALDIELLAALTCAGTVARRTGGVGPPAGQQKRRQQQKELESHTSPVSVEGGWDEGVRSLVPPGEDGRRGPGEVPRSVRPLVGGQP